MVKSRFLNFEPELSGLLVHLLLGALHTASQATDVRSIDTYRYRKVSILFSGIDII